MIYGPPAVSVFRHTLSCPPAWRPHPLFPHQSRSALLSLSFIRSAASSPQRARTIYTSIHVVFSPSLRELYTLSRCRRVSRLSLHPFDDIEQVRSAFLSQFCLTMV